MDYDTRKVDEATLALLFLTRGANGSAHSAWKGHDWDAMNRLYQAGLIENPANKNKSVTFTDEGRAQAEALFHQLFGKQNSE